MPITQILQFSVPLSPQDLSSLISKVIQTLTSTTPTTNFIIGTKSSEPTTIQATIEWPDTDNYNTLPSNPNYETFMSTLTANFGELTAEWDVPFEKSAFEPDEQGNRPATAPLVEYVQTYSPLSHTIPSYQAQISSTFAAFDSIFTTESVGTQGLTSGWSANPISHPKIMEKHGEEARAFVVIRGWKDMASFGESCGTEAFRRAAPMLGEMGGVFDLYHVERKGAGGSWMSGQFSDE